jgi:hypothetical protein
MDGVNLAEAMKRLYMMYKTLYKYRILYTQDNINTRDL